MRLVLASASPRRAELLRNAGFAFETLVVDLDERVRDGEPAATYGARLAGEKSAAGMQRFIERAQRACSGPERAVVHDVVVLGADTTAVVDGAILGKPTNDEDAVAMLRLLAGRRHEVITGVSLRSSVAERGRIETTS